MGMPNINLHTGRPAGHWRGETRSETLARLAVKARREGVQLYVPFGQEGAGVYIATSTGKSNVAYIVQPGNVEQGCTCPGYQSHMYCKHYAAACVAAGLMPEPPDDPPAAAAVASPPAPDWCAGCGALEPLHVHGLCASCAESYGQLMDDVATLDAAGMVAG